MDNGEAAGAQSVECDPKQTQGRFKVERGCGANLIPRGVKCPFVLRVKLPAEKVTDYRAGCDTQCVYRVLNRRTQGKSTAPRPYVCEHMGRLIE